MYAFDPAWEAEEERLEALAALCEAATLACLDAVGVRPGWRCLDVGAGTGSVARSLAGRVGPDGCVVATDVDTRYLEPAANIEVRRHDILYDPVETGAFDLVHARVVLAHLPERGLALDRMIAALRPGGWLVVGDLDWTDVLEGGEPSHPAFVRIAGAVVRLMRSMGYDPYYGRLLPEIFERAGLEHVVADRDRVVAVGGSAWAKFLSLSLEQLSALLVGAELLGEDDVVLGSAMTADPTAVFRAPTLVTVRGRKPAGDPDDSISPVGRNAAYRAT